MLKSIVFAGLSAILLLSSLSVYSEGTDVPFSELSSDSIIIDGDKFEMYLDKQMRSIGNASLHKGDKDIVGDVIEYNVQNDELHAVGNVHMNFGTESLSGPELHLRLSEYVGNMRDASFQSTKKLVKTVPGAIPKQISPSQLTAKPKQPSESGVTSIAGDSHASQTTDALSTPLEAIPVPPTSRGDASILFFESPDKKRLLDARYTTCAVGVDDWYMNSKEMKLDGYSESGVAKNATVEFKGIPIIYTPWMGFTYGGQRSTGFLTPSYGNTSLGGFEFTLPFYWNIAPNMDATLSARDLTKRGVQLQGQFRYLEENFSGIDTLEYLPSDLENSKSRYYLSLKHQEKFNNGWSAGFSYEKVSDNLYFSELSTHIVSTSRVLLPQQFNVNYDDSTWHFNGLVQKFQTLDGVSYPYERLPQLTLTGTKYYGDIKTNLVTQLAVFDTNSSNPNASGLPTGTRFTTYPTVSETFNRPYGYITPKVGAHFSSYALNNNPNPSLYGSEQQVIPTFSLDGGLYFDRDFQMADRAYSQTLEPRLFYVYIPNVDQSKNPVFDAGLIDLNFSSLYAENQFSGGDRVNNANQISTGITTRFIDTDTGIQRLSASIGQRYYFADQKVTLPGVLLRQGNSSDILTGLSANLQNNWKLDAYWLYNTVDSGTVRSTITARYNPEPGKVLNLSYTNRNDAATTLYFGVASNTPAILAANAAAIQAANVNQFNISGQWPLKPGWFAVGRINYSLQTKQMIESLAGVEYNAGCWKFRAVMQRITTITTIPGATTGAINNALFFQLELGGLASIGTDPLGVIKRSVPGYTNTNQIPETFQ